MRLTTILQFYQHRKAVPGRLFKGKHQVVTKVTTRMKENLLKWLMMEEKNIAILEKPYLSREEELGYMKPFQPPGVKPKILEQRLEQRQKTMPKHMYTTDHLEHLNVAKKWE